MVGAASQAGDADSSQAPGPRATNAEFYSNLRFLSKFEFFSGFCATKPITISNSDLLLSFFSSLRFALKSEIFLKCVCHQPFFGLS